MLVGNVDLFAGMSIAIGLAFFRLQKVSSGCLEPVLRLRSIRVIRLAK